MELTVVVIILGLGFTGKRLARRLRDRGIDVFAAVRGSERFGDMAQLGVGLVELKSSALFQLDLPKRPKIALLVPPIPEPEQAVLRAGILALHPERVVYVSSTGVYGDVPDVDEYTIAAPTDDRGRLRLKEEEWVASGPWSSIILRAAAIYGPGRGVHAALREGRMPRGIGSGLVSRIHVDDLAALIERALDSGLKGAWPVADEEPCSTYQIVRWYAEVLQIKSTIKPATFGNPITGRRVDGKKVFELLGVRLQYPSWRTGIPASLSEESCGSV
jgi:nucleoside-diphosphate-sugar epimerase